LGSPYQGFRAVLEILCLKLGVSMSKSFAVVVLAAFISGCSTYAADRYSISADNVTALRNVGSNQINVGEFTSTEPGLSVLTCRAVGPIKTPDGETFAEFVKEAFVSELKIAELYSPDGPVTLTGNLDEIDFSSGSGTWNIALTVDSSNGQSISVREDYSFQTSFAGAVACNQTAQALMPAVQDLIASLIADPRFPDLIQ